MIGEPGKPIDVTNGASIDNLRIGLQRGGVITGQIRDDAGQPLVHARVSALRLRSFNGQPRAVFVATEMTNDLGRYRLFGLPNGAYFVSATPASDANASIPSERDLSGDVLAVPRISPMRRP